jgi:hypothetical protein
VNPFAAWLSPQEIEADVKVVSFSESCPLPTCAQLQVMRKRGITPILLRPVRESDHEPGSRVGNVVYWGALSADDHHVDNECRVIEGLGHGR